MRIVTVTGAGGSIGSEICQQIVRGGGVDVIRAVGHSELPLWKLAQKIHALRPGGTQKLELYLGSVRDRRLMEAACDCAELVIHAAAHKHVPLCEQNPCEAILNNVEGSAVVADAASAAHAFLVHISTDKAVNPVSVMGQTKRVAELRIMAGWERGQRRAAIVRFGNVRGSSGSVLQLWQKQADAGGPITVTDRRCTRYMMTIQEAVELTLTASSWRAPGLFVFDMGEPKSIWDMAHSFAEVSRAHGFPLEVVETGLRPGEKLEEELFTGRCVTTAHRKIMQVIHASDSRLPLLAEFSIPRLVQAAAAGHKDAALAALRSLSAC